MSTEEEAALNEDEECSARQIVRHVCVALKRYFEAHLYIRAEQLRRAHMRESDDHRQLQHMPSYKVCSILFSLFKYFNSYFSIIYMITTFKSSLFHFLFILFFAGY